MYRQQQSRVAKLDLAAPVFNDKHVACNADDVLWIYHQIAIFRSWVDRPSHFKAVPAFGSSVRRNVEELHVVHGDGIESDGFHAMEVLQLLAEQRSGRETGLTEWNRSRDVGSGMWPTRWVAGGTRRACAGTRSQLAVRGSANERRRADARYRPVRGRDDRIHAQRRRQRQRLAGRLQLNRTPLLGGWDGQTGQ